MVENSSSTLECSQGSEAQHLFRDVFSRSSNYAVVMMAASIHLVVADTQDVAQHSDV